ncbi:MAG: hypothetical protein JOS17DRAFT_729552 [Linnemannia elongata]|nr:MAG: hypothetical protein JOS17DRAFT_729552 [Linnemannia elongata]
MVLLYLFAANASLSYCLHPVFCFHLFPSVPWFPKQSYLFSLSHTHTHYPTPSFFSSNLFSPALACFFCYFVHANPNHP